VGGAVDGFNSVFTTGYKKATICYTVDRACSTHERDAFKIVVCKFGRKLRLAMLDEVLQLDVKLD